MQPFDPDSEHYDGKKKMAETLARSSGASIAAIGLLNLSRRRVVDMWVGRGKTSAEMTEKAALVSASRALAVSLSLRQSDPALAAGEQVGRMNDESAPIWLRSPDHLIGIGARVGDLATFTALVCDPSTPADTPERRRMIELGLTYANQLLHERLDRAAKPSSFLPDMILRSLSFGFAVVEVSGAINYLKDGPEDWLADFEELRIVNGRLTAQTAQYQNQLHGALVSATTGARRPSVLTFETSDGPPKSVIVLPTPDDQPRALLIFGRNREDNALRELVLQSFGLTLAERRLALLLLSGKSLQTAAQEANLTISTARSYLKRIFAKTGINRQSQLVTLYYRMMPSVQAMLPPQNRPPRT